MSSTPTHRRSNSLEEQISSGRSKLRKTPQSDGSRRSSFSEGERADEVMGEAPTMVAPEAVAAAAARRAAEDAARERGGLAAPEEAGFEPRSARSRTRRAPTSAARGLASRTEPGLDRTLSAETAEPAAAPPPGRRPAAPHGGVRRRTAAPRGR